MYRHSVLLALSSFASAFTVPHQQLVGEPVATEHLIARKPLVDSQSLQDAISAKSLWQRAKHLYSLAKLSEDEYNHPTRVIGSEGHLATIDYIVETISSLGDYYTLSNQSFPAVVGSIFESRLVLGDSIPRSARAMSLTPPTKHKQPVFGPIVLVANHGCHSSDYPSDIADSIALIKRGECSFGTKSTRAGKAGAVGVVVYNNSPGSLSGTLGTPSKYHVATFGISDEDAKPILASLRANEEVDGSAYIDAVVSAIDTTNIIAQTRDGDPNNCVMLGGHSDSVGEGPGINDDGSGSLSLLEVATQLAKFRTPNCVRFAWWAGEEEGLLGSDWYVAQLSEEENAKIRLFMDYDMLASPNYALQVYAGSDRRNPVGSRAIRDLYSDWYTRHGYNWTLIPFDGRSDYYAFINSGIPGGGIATGAEGVKTPDEEAMFGGKAGEWFDSCYHQLCDDLNNLHLGAWEINTKLIAHSVATFALSFDGFPERAPFQSSAASEQMLYHGHKLVS